MTVALGASASFGAIMILTTQLEIGGLWGFVTPVWLILAATGFVLPNSPALALSRHGEAAGTAAAVLGAVQFGIGALIAPFVGVLGNDGTATAMTMTVGAVIALAALFAVRNTVDDQPSDAAAR